MIPPSAPAERRGPEYPEVDMRISDVLRRKGDVVVTISPDERVGTLLDALAVADAMLALENAASARKSESIFGKHDA